MAQYIIKVVGQDLYLKYDGTHSTNKSEAYTTDYLSAENIINNLNRSLVWNGESRRYEMTYC